MQEVLLTKKKIFFFLFSEAHPGHLTCWSLLPSGIPGLLVQLDWSSFSFVTLVTFLFVLYFIFKYFFNFIVEYS